MTHRIRLRTAWTRHTRDGQATVVGLPDAPAGDPPVARDEGRSPDLDTSDEAEWMVRYRRVFHCPTGLSAKSRVRLVIERWEGRLTVRLDDVVLAEDVPAESAPLVRDIRNRISGDHRLELSLARSDAGSPAPSHFRPLGLSGLVALEIDD